MDDGMVKLNSCEFTQSQLAAISLYGKAILTSHKITVPVVKDGRWQLESIYDFPRVPYHRLVKHGNYRLMKRGEADELIARLKRHNCFDT